MLVDWDESGKYDDHVSLISYIENNPDIIKRNYVNLISNICNNKIKNELLENFFLINDYSLWDMSLLVEKSHYKSPAIINCLKLIALEQIITTKTINNLTLICKDKKILESVKELCLNHNILFKFKKIKFFLELKNIIPHKFKAILFGLNYIYKRHKLFNNIDDLSNDKSEVLFISYFNHLDQKMIKTGEYNSNQWSNLSQILDKNIQTMWIHHFSSGDFTAFEAKKNIKKVNSVNMKQKHYLFDNALNLKDFIYIFYNYFKHISKFPNNSFTKNYFKIKNKKANFWYLLKDDWNSSSVGITALQNIIFIKSIENLISKIYKKKVGIYLMENQGWEKAVIFAWKKYQHLNLIGYQYALTRFWDLRYYFQDHKINLLPDIIAVSSEISYNYFKNSNITDSSLTKVENLRYKDFYSYNAKPILSSKIKEKILILADLDYSSNIELLNIFYNQVDIFSNFEITLRFHPSYKLNLPDKLKKKIVISDDSLKKLLENNDYIFAVNGTGSIIDAFLMKKNILIFLPNGELNLSPLRNFPDNVVFINKNSSLKKSILKVNKLKFSQSKIEYKFFNSRDLKLWRLVFNKIL